MVEPFYTFILTSRNDDHDLGLERINACLASLFQHMESRGIPSELILVEWNPPEDRPCLEAAIDWPTGMGSWDVRIITVPPLIHYQFAGPDSAIKVYVLAARNVGIRRARGQWVLPLNQDCYLSRSLADRLADVDTLQEGSFYRAIRADVPKAGAAPAKVHRPIGGDRPFTDGSGDFMLMRWAAWHRLRGYPEIPVYGLFLDAIQLHMALKGGYRQVIIPTPAYVYHIEHDHGWLPDKFAGLDAMGYDYITEAEYEEWAEQIERGEMPYIFNGEDWGFLAYDFPERTIHVT